MKIRQSIPILAMLLGLGAGAWAYEAASPPSLAEEPGLQVARLVACGVPQPYALPHQIRRQTNLREMTLGSLLESLTSAPHRRAGSEYGRRTETFLANAFRALGCAVTRQQVPVNDWDCEKISLTVAGEGLACSAMPFSPFGEVSGRLVYVGEARDLTGFDVAGAVVVAEQRYPQQPLERLWDLRLPGTTIPEPRDAEPAWWLNGPGITPSEATAAGAVGLVQVLMDQFGDTPVRYSPQVGPLSGVPTAYVCRKAGERLKDAAANGLRATLEIRGQLKRAFGENIVAELEGISSRVYLFAAHHDSPGAGAVDDAASLVAMLELARHYSSLPVSQRPGRMVFACTTGHYDGAVGTRMLAQEILPRWRYKYRGIFALEQLGARAARREDGRLIPLDEPARQDVFVPDHDRLRAAVQSALEAAQLPNTLVVPDKTDVFALPPGVGGALCSAGLPTVQFMSAPPYILTDEDKPDMVDLTRVSKQVDLLIDIVSRL